MQLFTGITLLFNMEGVIILQTAVSQKSCVNRFLMSETFGQYVRRHRKTLSMTQDELARKSGISQSYVSGIEREVNKDVSREDVKKLARALEVPAADALTAAGLSLDADVIESISDLRRVEAVTLRGQPVYMLIPEDTSDQELKEMKRALEIAVRQDD